MKYRIIEHSNENEYRYFTVEFLRKGILWGESWKTVGQSNQYKMYVSTRFSSLNEAQRYIKAQKWSERIVEEVEI